MLYLILLVSLTITQLCTSVSGTGLAVGGGDTPAASEEDRTSSADAEATRIENPLLIPADISNERLEGAFDSFSDETSTIDESLTENQSPSTLMCEEIGPLTHGIAEFMARLLVSSSEGLEENTGVTDPAEFLSLLQTTCLVGGVESGFVARSEAPTLEDVIQPIPSEQSEEYQMIRNALIHGINSIEFRDAVLAVAGDAPRGSLRRGAEEKISDTSDLDEWELITRQDYDTPCTELLIHSSRPLLNRVDLIREDSAKFLIDLINDLTVHAGGFAVEMGQECINVGGQFCRATLEKILRMIHSLAHDQRRLETLACNTFFCIQQVAIAIHRLPERFPRLTRLARSLFGRIFRRNVGENSSEESD